MPRKKAQTYNDMVRLIEDMQKRMEQEKTRIAHLMAESMWTPKAAAVLGDYSDSDLRRIMSMVAEDIGAYAARLETEKKERSKPKNEQTAPERGIVYQPEQRA